MTGPSTYISTEVRLQVDDGGKVWTPHSAARYERWLPYVGGLGPVTLVGRLGEGAETSAGRADGPGVDVLGLPHYLGLRQMIQRLPSVIVATQKIGAKGDLFIGRLPEPLSILMFLRALRLRAQFVSLVVADPRQLVESMRPGRQGRLGGALLAAATRAIIARSSATIYVTQEWLQRLYPPPPGRPTLARSNVSLDDGSFVPAPRNLTPARQRRLVTVGTLGSPAKGTDVLLDVVAALVADGRDVSLDVVGGGRQLEALQEQADALGLADRVTFHGHVGDAETVRMLLDRADIYVSASRVEGLPRATVEALARALPVVTTDAGGVRELVAPDLVLPIDDRRGLRQAVVRLLDDSAAYEAVSETNLRRAYEIRELAREQHLSDFLMKHVQHG